MKMPSLKELQQRSKSAASSLSAKFAVRSFLEAGGLRIIAGLVLATGLVAAAVHKKVTDAYHRADTAALRADSIEAVLDTTRHVRVGKDSVDVWRRRAIQHKLEKDKLEAKLRSRAVQHAAMVAYMSGLVDSLNAPAEADSADSVRSAHFSVDTVPFKGNIDVKIPRPPASAIARVNIAVDTARIGLSVRCGEPQGGVRPAEVVATTPPWLRIRIDSTEQETRVCNPQIPTKPKKGVVRKYGPPALLVWLGYLLH